MYKLTLLMLFFIFSYALTLSSVQAEEPPADPMNNQTLWGRSYQPDLAHAILLRSIGSSRPAPQAQPKPAPEAQTQRLPDLSQPVFKTIPKSVSPPLKEVPKPAPSTPLALHPDILDNLEKYSAQIERYSRMNHVDANLVRALIYVESAGNPRAVSHKGARGLMQLMPGTAREMGVSNPLDPAQNIFGGARYIGNLLERFEHLDLALWAYNAGPEAVKNKRLPLETKRFIPKVLRIKSILDRKGS